VSPLTLGGTYLALQVETEDIDSAFEGDRCRGDVFHAPAGTFWEERRGQFIDPFGHRRGVQAPTRRAARRDRPGSGEGSRGVAVPPVPAGGADLVTEILRPRLARHLRRPPRPAGAEPRCLREFMIAGIGFP